MPTLPPTPSILLNSPNDINNIDWASLASGLQQPINLDTSSIQLITDKTSENSLFSQQSKIREQQINQRIAIFEQLLAEDTVRNEFGLRTYIHRWFSEGNVKNFEQLNQRVYSELFLTPASDPWLGLISTDLYQALENDGVEQKL